MDASEKFCVLRGGDSWFAVPATSIREVGPCPPWVPVPGGGLPVVGICHWRNEFLPVIALTAVMGDASETASSQTTAGQMVIMTHSSGPWLMLVDQVTTLETLEVALTCRGEHEGGSMVLGTAACRDRVVRVLNPAALFRQVEQAIQNSLDIIG